ncbi:DUF4336 domain-containing protein [Octadecabacter sp. CECT 8868]|uniref:DUF4336 domain-containing protein n=1 Tax=Octadecabacter algicola TaxID=2909342 RepID=UPI001F1F8B96|nr:DUF4336 domain-containing protein [Octadecabacter algicola]MCF2905651.1 DUF4336 domain-containing protein [Octadecabacter algicola]
MTYNPVDQAKLIDTNIWIFDGPHIKFYGIPFPTRMTVVRLRDGGLWIHSPIHMSDEVLRNVNALGEVKHLIAPNWIHYASVGTWSDAFPDAITWGAPGVEDRARSRNVPLRIDNTFGPNVVPPWADEIEWHHVQGSTTHQEVVFFHKASRTLILTDLIENFEKTQVSVWMWPLLRLAGNTDPDGKMPIDMANTFRKGRDHLRRSVEHMIAWAPRRVIIAHGRWYRKNGVAELRRAFRKVLK